MRKMLSLHPKPSPASAPKVDPEKAAMAEALGLRFITRDYRHICQKLIITYETVFDIREGKTVGRTQEVSRTWMDIPLVPEVYFG